MTQHLVLLLACFLSLPAFAQQARVIKTKGYQAIVQFPEGEKPRVGQMINIAEDDGVVSEPGRAIGTGKRAHLLALQGELSMLSVSTSGGATSTSDTRTTISVTGRYGWNFENWEAGPLGTFTMTTGSDYSNRVMSVGGFFDWNLVPNRAGTVFVYGAGGSLEVGQTSQTIGSTQTDTSLLSGFGGGQMKWFGLSENVAIRADAGLLYSQSSVGSSKTTNMGFKGLAGISFYF
ncbi:MAG: hypothetical protein V4692_13300 [Bdellovibrionota bacterium]